MVFVAHLLFSTHQNLVAYILAYSYVEVKILPSLKLTVKAPETIWMVGIWYFLEPKARCQGFIVSFREGKNPWWSLWSLYPNRCSSWWATQLKKKQVQIWKSSIKCHQYLYIDWLVVSTHLKNISHHTFAAKPPGPRAWRQIGSFPQVGVEHKKK